MKAVRTPRRDATVFCVAKETRGSRGRLRTYGIDAHS